MNDRAAAPETQSIVVEFDVPHPPKKVWRALTVAEYLSAWLMPTDIRAEVGHRFTFKTKPMGDWDGTVECQVTDVEPERLIRYTWKGGSDNLEAYGRRLDTVVTWTLTPTRTGTHVRLDHDGFKPENAFAFEMMGKGWVSMGEAWRDDTPSRLKTVLAEMA